MNKFLAVLKDSYREAMNGWLLQTMAILIALVLILVLSVSFRQLTMAEVLQARFDLVNALLAQNPEFGSPELSVEKAVESNPIEPWSSGHEFDLVVTCPSIDDLKKADKARLPVTKERMEQMMRAVDLLKDVTVSEVAQPLNDLKPDVEPPIPDPKAPKKVGQPVSARFRVTASSTTVKERLEWPHQITILFVVPVNKSLSAIFGGNSPRDVVYMVQNYLVNGIGGWIITMIAVVITSSFIPNMMNKGALDLLIAKPIGRVSLLVYKYIGGLTFMFLLTSLLVLGVYLTIGVRTGVWSQHFLLAVPLLTLQFAILYAVSTLFGVLTRNALVAILATVAVWFLFFAVGKVNDGIRNRGIENKKVSEMIKSGKFDELDENGRRRSKEELQREFDPNRNLWGLFPPSSFPVLQSVHAVFPRTFQLDSRIGRTIAEGVLTERQLKTRGWDEPPDESWPELLLVNLAFIAVMLGLAAWRFITRDG